MFRQYEETAQTFEEFLSTRNPTSSTLLNVARLYINERTDYLPPEEMRQQLVGAAEDNAAVTSVIQDLAHDNGLCSGYVRKPVTVCNTLKNNALQVLNLSVITSVSMDGRIGVRKRVCRWSIEYY
jgi:hypothetical protein